MEGHGTQELSTGKMPVVFVPHGGGPWPFIRNPLGAPKELNELVGYLLSVRSLPENAATRAPRRVRSLGRAGTDGDDRRTPTDALRLLWLPP